ncbi:unnamed protein product [Aureobasidium pullulans]|nr:unnamed protein product [Aureobasidium pullulans]
MSNVAASTPPKDPVKQARALTENLPDAGLRGLDHCASSHTLANYQNGVIV